MFEAAIVPILEEQGYTLKGVDFSDLLTADIALNDGDVDVNVEQHTAYAENFNSNNNGDLVPISPIPTVPAGIYSGTHTSLDEVTDGAKIAVPNDASNTARAYVLYMLTQNQLSHIQFPLGGKMKKEVREIAEQLGFCNAWKHDSQDICFVPNGDYVKFMEQYTGKHYPAGAFLDLEGQPVGRHCGAVRYTLGQRKGLGLAMGEPVYVCGKDMAANTVTVGPENALYSSMLLAEDMNWISIPQLKQPMRVKAKTRYRQAEQWAAVYPEQHGRVRLEFDAPQRAVTVGQAVVLYDGDVVVGGGTICQAPPTKR